MVWHSLIHSFATPLITTAHLDKFPPFLQNLSLSHSSLIVLSFKMSCASIANKNCEKFAQDVHLNRELHESQDMHVLMAQTALTAWCHTFSNLPSLVIIFLSSILFSYLFRYFSFHSFSLHILFFSVAMPSITICLPSYHIIAINHCMRC